MCEFQVPLWKSFVRLLDSFKEFNYYGRQSIVIERYGPRTVPLFKMLIDWIGLYDATTSLNYWRRIYRRSERVHNASYDIVSFRSVTWHPKCNKQVTYYSYGGFYIRLRNVFIVG
jgi:hypothetical protein